MRALDKLAILLGALVAVGAFVFLQQLGPRPAPTTQIIIAQRAISSYVPITQADLAFKTVPVQGLDDRILRDPARAIGKVSLVPILDGEPLMADKLGESHYLLGPGYRAVAIDTNLVATAGGQVLPGDMVDLYWVSRSGGDPGGLLAPDVRVLDVRSSDNKPYRMERGGVDLGITVAGQRFAAGTSTMPAVVVLRLKSSDIAPVLGASSRGTVYLARQPVGSDPEPVASAPRTQAEVIGSSHSEWSADQSPHSAGGD